MPLPILSRQWCLKIQIVSATIKDSSSSFFLHGYKIPYFYNLNILFNYVVCQHLHIHNFLKTGQKNLSSSFRLHAGLVLFFFTRSILRLSCLAYTWRTGTSRQHDRLDFGQHHKALSKSTLASLSPSRHVLWRPIQKKLHLAITFSKLWSLWLWISLPQEAELLSMEVVYSGQRNQSWLYLLQKPRPFSRH